MARGIRPEENSSSEDQNDHLLQESTNSRNSHMFRVARVLSTLAIPFIETSDLEMNELNSEEYFLNYAHAENFGVSYSPAMRHVGRHLSQFANNYEIRQAREDEEQCQQTFFWSFIVSLHFARYRICQWVQENGGWWTISGTVYNVVYKILSLCASVAIICACITYIRRNS